LLRPSLELLGPEGLTEQLAGVLPFILGFREPKCDGVELSTVAFFVSSLGALLEAALGSKEGS
jgi:hypothetical protein